MSVRCLKNRRKKNDNATSKQIEWISVDGIDELQSHMVVHRITSFLS